MLVPVRPSAIRAVDDPAVARAASNIQAPGSEAIPPDRNLNGRTRDVPSRADLEQRDVEVRRFENGDERGQQARSCGSNKRDELTL